jgi:hypothetical protein
LLVLDEAKSKERLHIWDKYPHNKEDTIMDTIDDQNDGRFDVGIDAQREMIRHSLGAIANDIGMALRDVGLRFPVYLTVPNSGDALTTFATPLDPSDDDWAAASGIVTRIVSKALGTCRYATGLKNVPWRELR